MSTVLPLPTPAIDHTRLAEEYAAGLDCHLDVPLSQTHLAALALSAEHTLYEPGVSDPVKALLLDFLGWCTRHGGLGPETRKLIALQAAARREPDVHAANGYVALVQTHGQE